MVLFDLLPNTTRGPLAYAEIAPSLNGNVLAVKPLVVLAIGQKRAGTVPALTLTRVRSADEASQFFGAGSQLHDIATGFFKNNKSNDFWAMPINDAAGSASEERTLTFSTAATAAGTLYLYLSGSRIAVAVAAGESTTTTATNVAAAIAAVPANPWVPTAATNVVTLVAKNKGTLGAELDVRVNYNAGESLPVGLTVGQAVTVAGAGVVDYSTLGLFGYFTEIQFDLIVAGANDATNLAYITTELLDRWGPTRMIEGCVISGFQGDLAAALAKGALVNSPFSAIMPANLSPTTPWRWAGALAGVVAFHGGQDPARPFHTLTLTGVLPPATVAVFSAQERELLLRAGMATYRVSASGEVQIHRLITNSQTNAAGAKDATYLDLNTPLTLAFLRYDWRTTLLTKYPRHKLANDGTNFAAGQPIMTPERGRAEAVAWFGKMEQAGLVEDVEQFKTDLVVERNPSDPNRLDFLLPINLVNQLQVIGSRIEFTL